MAWVVLLTGFKLVSAIADQNESVKAGILGDLYFCNAPH